MYTFVYCLYYLFGTLLRGEPDVAQGTTVRQGRIIARAEFKDVLQVVSWVAGQATG